MCFPCKPGYLRLTDSSCDTTLELIPYETFILRPEIRKGLLSKISAGGYHLSCGCQPAGSIPVRISKDLTYDIPQNGHMPECGTYLQRIRSIVKNGYLKECLSSEPPYRVSFRTADRKRFPSKLDCLDSFDLDGASARNMGLHELVGLAVSKAYNRSAEIRGTQPVSAIPPRPNSILSALEIEFNLMRIIDADGIEISLSERMCNPAEREPGNTDFLVARINCVKMSGKDAVLYCSVSCKGWVGPQELPVHVPGKDWELFMLSHRSLTGGNCEGRFSELHIAGFVKHYERKTMGKTHYNSRTHARYSSEEAQTYILTGIRGAVLFSLSSYGMLICHDRQKELSDAYNRSGFRCTKPILPVACCNEIPDMVISNPGGPDLVFVYPYADEEPSNEYVKIVNY